MYRYNMSDQLYFVLILLLVVLALSRLIVRLYQSENPKAKNAILYFRMLLGFLIAMLIYTLFGVLRGQDVIGKIFGK